ncbi:double-CXXCG motif protein [Stigmatella sp. ncwal1]|uniref:Double-CXXCG motif protein n=1 Tax=Stigmatella ashevillensis TaxID=2995309 RepID=A0ABT5D0K3_9BACT|nr:double-CXXCG motif protein [Stigmatella ashevillena]MDC0707197.1 double-CXXCG motif protein [Stigmatella ashevillena]
MGFYSVEGIQSSRYAGEIEGEHRWSLPGIRCPHCRAVWSTGAVAYPSVDLTNHPEGEQLKEAHLEEDFAEFERLRESVRPLIPGKVLHPGTDFGPFVGTAHGTFGPLVIPSPWVLMMRREAFERLQAEGLQGLKGCSMEVRFRQKKNPPELVELELLPLGLLHEDCIPPDQREPCPRCGRLGFSLPEIPLLKAASLPKGVDLFRLANFATVIIATHRFVETARQLWPEERLNVRELHAR